MDPLATNPFGILMFIVAPAILTNASSAMALSTSNRFARALDRARALSSQVQAGRTTPTQTSRRRSGNCGPRKGGGCSSCGR